MNKLVVVVFIFISFACQSQVVFDDCFGTDEFDVCITLTRKDTTTVIIPEIDTLNAVDSTDLLVFVLSGQSLATGFPTSLTGMGTVPTKYEGQIASEYFIGNAHWANYIYNPGSFGPDVSLMHYLDSIYPGQVRLLKWTDNGSRLRDDIRTSKRDWNVNSTNENWERMKKFSLGTTTDIQGLNDLISLNPGKNIRLMSWIWVQGESDCNINTDAGDSLTLTSNQARDIYVTDMKALYSDFKNHVSTTFGLDTTELELQIVEVGSGSAVRSRFLYPGIREAEQIITNDLIDAFLIDGDSLETVDDIHLTIQGNIDVGLRLAKHNQERLNN